MNIVSNTEYEKAKSAFLKKHPDWVLTTSPIDSSGTYTKTYIAEKNSAFYEVFRPVVEHATAEVEVKGVKVKIADDVKLLEIECWSSDHSESLFTYEKF